MTQFYVQRTDEDECRSAVITQKPITIIGITFNGTHYRRCLVGRRSGASIIRIYLRMTLGVHSLFPGSHGSKLDLVVFLMLILEPTGRHYDAQWSDNDYIVLDDKRTCMGRIFLSTHSPPDRDWMWTITASEYPPTIHSCGYSATREDAMADFKQQWLARSL